MPLVSPPVVSDKIITFYTNYISKLDELINILNYMRMDIFKTVFSFSLDYLF